MPTGRFCLLCDPTYFGEGILQLGEVNLVESIVQIVCIIFRLFFVHQFVLEVTRSRKSEKSEMGLPGLKSRCWQPAFLLEALGKNIFPAFSSS